MAYQDALVVDAVSHAYNHTEANYVKPVARDFDEKNLQLANRGIPEHYQISREKYFQNHSAENLERLLFHESDVDFTFYHPTPITELYEDGYVSMESGLELRERNPNRVALYGQVNPMDGEEALEQMEHQVEELGVTGIKLYPARFEDGRSLRLALDDQALPILEKARELDIETIAVHKAIPSAYNTHDFYDVDDIDRVAPQFPDLNFEIVHAGMAFLEQTVFMLARYDNVYANLEVTANFLIAKPRRFAKILGEMLYWAGPEKVIFATGATFAHPQPLIEALWDFEFPDDLAEGHKYPKLTQADKHKILGLNALELHGLNPDTIRKSIEDDEWQQRRAESQPEPWSCIEAKL